MSDIQNPIEEEMLQQKDIPGDTDLYFLGDTVRNNPDLSVTHKNLRNSVQNVVDGKSARQPEASTTALVLADFDNNIDNVGAGGAVVYTLPAVADVKGLALSIFVGAAQQISLSPASGEKVYLFGDGVATKDLIIAGVIGNFVELYSDGTDYVVTKANGVVTKEA